MNFDLEKWQRNNSLLAINSDIAKKREETLGEYIYTSNFHSLQSIDFIFEKISEQSSAGRTIRRDINLSKLSQDQVRRLIEQNACGETGISDKQKEAIDQSYGVYPLTVFTAQKRVVTAKNPIIIDSTQAVTNYGDIVIEAGGYIEIRTSCFFYCQSLEIQKQSKTIDDDRPVFLIAGRDGKAGIDGNIGTWGPNGHNGNGASCICCHTAVAHGAGNGANGGAGGPGNRGHDGGNGAMGPVVKIQINNLQSTMVITNRGGNGGNGGHGGCGGHGGNGGNGGNGIGCEAFNSSGGDGGNGGDGNNGGNGGNGGNGLAGAQVTGQYKSPNGSTIISVVDIALAGIGGPGGNPGLGGSGGNTGYRGNKQGSAGNTGSVSGNTGSEGQPGTQGTTNIQLMS